MMDAARAHRIRIRAGVVTFNAHVLRHTWATNFMRQPSADLAAEAPRRLGPLGDGRAIQPRDPGARPERPAQSLECIIERINESAARADPECTKPPERVTLATATNANSGGTARGGQRGSPSPHVATGPTCLERRADRGYRFGGVTFVSRSTQGGKRWASRSRSRNTRKPRSSIRTRR